MTMRFLLAVILCLTAHVAMAGVPRGGGTPCIQGVPQPSVAASNNLNCLVRYDNFTSTATIDTTNSGAAGYNWYGINPFGYASTPSSDYSVAANTLSITDTPGPGVALQSLSFISSTANPPTYNGTIFGPPPVYIQFKMAVQQSLAPGATKSGIIGCAFGSTPIPRVAWPAIWIQDYRLVALQTNLQNSVIPYAEIDIMEMNAGCPNGSGAGVWAPHNNLIIWKNSYISPGICDCNIINPAGPWDGTTLHTEGLLIVPSTMGGGIGIVKFYHDGSITSTISYSSTDEINATDNALFMMLLAPGFSWPVSISQVEIWQGGWLTH